VLEAAQQFGFDWDSFKEWFESQDSNLFENTGWPPTQVSYMLDGPEFDDEFFETLVESPPAINDGLRLTPVSTWPTSGNPMVSPERLEIFAHLREGVGVTWGVGGNIGSRHMLSQNEARSWARLVAATVQAWHDNLANPEVRLSSPYADDMFTYNLLESICVVPRESWTRLTDARRICLIADLGELLMVISELSGGDITSRAAGALGSVCNYEDDLISFGEQAGLALPYQDGRMEFDSGIDSIRGFVPFD
jgi:hypothetical protein